MFLIPGVLVGLLTFPGIIVHEIGHLLLCRVTGVKVHGWCLFRLKNPMGFVIHDAPKEVWKNFLITFGPFFVNTILTVFLAFFYALIPNIILLWLTFSVGMHAFPSTGDGKSLWKATTESFKLKQYLNAVFLPFVGIIYLGAVLSVFWFDAIYAGAIVYGTETVVINNFPFLPKSYFNQHFENQVISFDYPRGIQTEVNGSKTFETVKEQFEESELYFVATKGNNALIVIYGSDSNINTDLNMYGRIMAMVEEGEDVSIEKSGLETYNSLQWYNIVERINDSEGNLSKIFSTTYCKNRLTHITIVGEKLETETFETIANSFKCKEELI